MTSPLCTERECQTAMRMLYCEEGILYFSCTLHSALTTIHSGLAIEDVKQAQQNDAMIQKLRNALEISQCPQEKQEWRKQPLRRLLQLWSQLVIHDGMVCRKYRPMPTCEPIMVPILPISMHYQVLRDHQQVTWEHKRH